MNPQPPREDAICILNGSAGSNRAGAQREAITSAFAKQGKAVRIVVADGGRSLIAHAQAAAKEKVPLVIAAGGDGTVSAVACMIAGSDSVLGVLPLGTLNHFAKDMKIPLALDEAVAVIVEGTAARIDVGELNGQVFINNSSLGFYPGVVQLRDTLQRQGHRKWLAFVGALLHTFRRASPFAMQLTSADGAEKAIATPFAFVGNNRYELAPPHIGERRSLTEGKLWVYRAPQVGRWGLLKLALHTVFGRGHPAELDVVSATEFSIQTRRRRIHVANDGEVMALNTPLHYRSVPGALRVMVPAPRTDSPA